jgi:hypothetical protein
MSYMIIHPHVKAEMKRTGLTIVLSAAGPPNKKDQEQQEG